MSLIPVIPSTPPRGSVPAAAPSTPPRGSVPAAAPSTPSRAASVAAVVLGTPPRGPVAVAVPGTPPRGPVAVAAPNTPPRAVPVRSFLGTPKREREGSSLERTAKVARRGVFSPPPSPSPVMLSRSSRPSCRSLFLQRAAEVRENGTIFDGKVRFLEIARGQCQLVARLLLPAGAPPLIPGVANEALLLKTFHERVPAPTSTLHLNILSQYKALRERGIEAAAIYNVDEAAAGCGFYLVENIPFEITPPTTREERQKLVREIRALFVAAYEAGICIDLSNLGNVRRRTPDGPLVVVDFREHPPERRDEFEATYAQMIREISRQLGCSVEEMTTHPSLEHFRAVISGD